MAFLPANVKDAYRYDGPNEALPLFVYKLPPHYTPNHLVISIIFKGEQPSEIWGIHTPHLFEVSSIHYERRIIFHEGTGWYYLDYERPQQGYYYGFGWRYNRSAE